MALTKSAKDSKPRSKKGVLSEGTMSYYRRAHENFLNDTTTQEDPESKSIFLLNIFRELKKEALVVCQNQTVSHYIETFLKKSDPKHIYYLWQIISSDWMEFCTDRCASHVLQKTLLFLPDTFDIDPAELLFLEDEEEDPNNDAADYDDDRSGGGGKERVKQKCKKKSKERSGAKELVLPRDSFLRFCGFLDDNIEALITDIYSSHIVRTSLLVLANRPPRTSSIITSTTRSQKPQYSKPVIEEFQQKLSKDDPNFQKCFFKISRHICVLENIYSYFTHKSANPVVQLLVQLTMDLDKEVGKKLCRRIIKLCGFLDIPPVDTNMTLIDSSRLPDLMMNPVSSYLADELLQSCPDDLFLTWYECSFKDRLIAYAVHAASSYVLRLVIDRCVNKDMLKVIYAELIPHIEDILALNHMGIVKSLANVCLKFHCKEKKFVASLMNAFHCSDEEKRKYFVLLLLTMKTYEIYLNPDEPSTIPASETDHNKQHSAHQNRQDGSSTTLPHPSDIHGSILIQTLVKFSNPQIIVSSFFGLSDENLLDLACDFQGQYILTQFFESVTISDNEKDNLLGILQPLLLKMACSKFGSRTCQSMWSHLTYQQKVKVADQLSKNSVQLHKHFYGVFVFNNLQLHLFMHNNKKWTSKQSVNTTKRKIFADILDENKSQRVK